MNNLLIEQQFWTGILILIRNYHAINRKIFACILHKVLKVKKGIEGIHVEGKNTWEEFGNHADGTVYEVTEVALDSALQAMTGGECGSGSGEYAEGFIIVYKFLTKKLSNNVEAVGKIDFINKRYTCKFLNDTLDDFFVQFVSGDLSCGTLATHGQHAELVADKRWTDFVLKPKLLKWCKSKPLGALNGAGEQIKQTQSLQLVDLEKYNDLYKTLKCKYVEKALKCWNTAKESTDPLKFIYEDLAIAAYLITLWQHVGQPSGFADLGCGNGLLVYILCEESYNGYGYDVRARKIWSCYPSTTTRLIEQTIEPENFQMPAEVDWLIGNHSDELSPWLAVLAATTGFNMCYFLLPCCAYELSGAKFQRRNTNASIYQDFYSYLETLSQKCGFATLKDRLKIPSTKRLALVGCKRTHARGVYDEKLLEIAELVKAERRKYGNMQTSKVKLRERNEAVRNCTQIDKGIIDLLVLKIFHMLLENVTPNDDYEAVSWQTGGAMRMCEIINCLDKHELQSIKAECGGIKTLLRNKHEIFEFLGEDRVGIRRPKLLTAPVKLQTVKKRNCFFHLHHPNGCPLADEKCTFIH